MTNDTCHADSDPLLVLMPLTWAFAVYLFIIAGSAMESERLVTNNEEYGNMRNRANMAEFMR
ncbi:hypothetical protein [Gracilibacillus dipsosauri]|uniref:hypothetical protein n=1 Tax=Gracilibacillus dipsosauri TaxID=178340 RepID=UPI000D7056E7|nr:hypothetical protein [Gracilibacillus dipsosauri]